MSFVSYKSSLQTGSIVVAPAHNNQTLLLIKLLGQVRYLRIQGKSLSDQIYKRDTYIIQETWEMQTQSMGKPSKPYKVVCMHSRVSVSVSVCTV